MNKVDLLMTNTQFVKAIAHQAIVYTHIIQHAVHQPKSEAEAKDQVDALDANVAAMHEVLGGICCNATRLEVLAVCFMHCAQGLEDEMMYMLREASGQPSEFKFTTDVVDFSEVLKQHLAKHNKAEDN